VSKKKKKRKIEIKNKGKFLYGLFLSNTYNLNNFKAELNCQEFWTTKFYNLDWDVVSDRRSQINFYLIWCLPREFRFLTGT
jgi:hypothetical protein